MTAHRISLLLIDDYIIHTFRFRCDSLFVLYQYCIYPSDYKQGDFYEENYGCIAF